MPTLEKDEVKLNYIDEGCGPVVLLLQGIGVSANGWRYQIDELKSSYRTISIDNRGISGSLPCSGEITIENMAQDAIDLLKFLKIESAHIVGHSMGGMIAQEIAFREPKMIKSLSLICTFSSGAEGARPTPWTIWMGIRTWVGTKEMRRRAYLEMIFSKKYLESINQSKLALEIAPIIGRDLSVQPNIIMKQLRALGKYNRFKDLKLLSRFKVLVLSAEQDKIAKPLFGERIAKEINNAQYIEIKDVSHGVILESPKIVNSLLMDFFK